MLPLFIEDQQTDICKRREDCASCADHDVDLPAPDQRVGISPLPQRQAAVDQRNAVSESRLEILHDLRRQRDLRYQQKHLSALLQRQKNELLKGRTGGS